MACIPQDIIINILYHLPAKYVAQFRCVSKEWLSLLSEPQFIQTHQKTLARYHFTMVSDFGLLHSLSYNNDHEEAVVSTLTMKHDLGFYFISDILGSVNGLVLAKAHRDEFAGYIPLVFNPTTKDYLELPISSRKYIFYMNGFGYDSVTGDYKIVTFHYFDQYCGFVDYGIFSVYNLRTNTWKHVITHYPYDEYHKSSAPGVFVNGFLHWIVMGPSKRQVILAFSLADEKLSELPPPNLYNEVDIVSDPNTKLGALGEKLAIFNNVKGDIWLMNEYGVQKSWTKIVLHGFNKIPMYGAKVVYDNGKVLSLTKDLLWIYDVEEQTLCKSVDISYMKYPFLLSAYSESLTSPKFSISN